MPAQLKFIDGHSAGVRDVGQSATRDAITSLIIDSYLNLLILELTTRLLSFLIYLIFTATMAKYNVIDKRTQTQLGFVLKNFMKNFKFWLIYSKIV